MPPPPSHPKTKSKLAQAVPLLSVSVKWWTGNKVITSLFSICLFLSSPLSNFVKERVLEAKIYLLKVDLRVKMSKMGPLFSPYGPFWALLEAILDFIFGEVVQSVSDFPLCP